MIKIKPVINYTTACPYCNGKTTTSRVIWQGIHIGVVSSCVTCKVEIVADLPVGQAQFTPYQLNVAKNEIFGDACALKWFGRPFLESLRNPYEHYPITVQVEKRRNIRDVVILNCIDYLYGHSLLKLLNADSYQKMDQNVGLVVIVPSFLRWMVPNYVAEIWVVNIPLSKSKNYFPKLNEEIQHQLTRFNQVYVSLAYSHPINFDIVNFTGVKPFELNNSTYQITFIWRAERIWAGKLVAKFLNILSLDLNWQNYKILHLFKLLKSDFPEAEFTIAGLGKQTRFPNWINDKRVTSFDDSSERESCQLYSKSNLVIGVHGSNMLLPSAHAWATIDLMPNERWPNMAQDILYQASGDDVRMTSWRYRFLPIRTSIKQVALVAKSTLLHAKTALEQFELTKNSM